MRIPADRVRHAALVRTLSEMPREARRALVEAARKERDRGNADGDMRPSPAWRAALAAADKTLR